MTRGYVSSQECVRASTLKRSCKKKQPEKNRTLRSCDKKCLFFYFHATSWEGGHPMPCNFFICSKQVNDSQILEPFQHNTKNWKHFSAGKKSHQLPLSQNDSGARCPGFFQHPCPERCKKSPPFCAMHGSGPQNYRFIWGRGP